MFSSTLLHKKGFRNNLDINILKLSKKFNEDMILIMLCTFFEDLQKEKI